MTPHREAIEFNQIEGAKPGSAAGLPEVPVVLILPGVLSSIVWQHEPPSFIALSWRQYVLSELAIIFPALQQIARCKWS